MAQLIINNTVFSFEAIAHMHQEAVTALPAWQQSIVAFVKDWFAATPTIEVKTSGSTGKPKLIQLEKQSVINSALITASYLQLHRGTQALLALSADYIAGKMMLARAMVNEWDLFCIEPSHISLLGLPPIQFTALVPLQIARLASNPLELEHLKQIDKVIIGGASISDALQKLLADFPNEVYETFGMTETISHIAMRRLSGKVAPYFETVDTNIILGQDDRDCLVVIANALNPQPIVTNDVVEMVDERRFKWLGRVDNVINTGGVKIIAEEWESRIASAIKHRYIAAAKSDKELGQKLILIIESNTYSENELQALKDALSKLLIRYEMPKEYYFIQKLNETANQKIDRKATLRSLGLSE